jgi:glutathione S-transferase
MPKIEVYSTPVCPFCRRVRIVLIEKKIAHSVTDLDLTNKPEWFLKISPYKKVPGLKRGKDTIWESSIINEYIEELYPEPALLPKDPGGRAWARFWIDYCNVKLAATSYKLTVSQTPEQIQTNTQDLLNQLSFIENEAFSKKNDGRYWLGAKLSLVDASYYPFFERFCVIERHQGFTIPNHYPKIRAWIAAMREQPSVQQTFVPEEVYLKTYAKYAPVKSGA